MVVYFGVLRCGDVFFLTPHQKTKSNLPSRVRFFLIFFWGGFEIYPDLRFVHTTIFIRIWDLTIRFYPELNLISCLLSLFLFLFTVFCFQRAGYLDTSGLKLKKKIVSALIWQTNSILVLIIQLSKHRDCSQYNLEFEFQIAIICISI